MYISFDTIEKSLKLSHDLVKHVYVSIYTSCDACTCIYLYVLLQNTRTLAKHTYESHMKHMYDHPYWKIYFTHIWLPLFKDILSQDLRHKQQSKKILFHCYYEYWHKSFPEQQMTFFSCLFVLGRDFFMQAAAGICLQLRERQVHKVCNTLQHAATQCL